MAILDRYQLPDEHRFSALKLERLTDGPFNQGRALSGSESDKIDFLGLHVAPEMYSDLTAVQKKYRRLDPWIIASIGVRTYLKQFETDSSPRLLTDEWTGSNAGIPRCIVVPLRIIDRHNLHLEAGRLEVPIGDIMRLAIGQFIAGVLAQDPSMVAALNVVNRGSSAIPPLEASFGLTPHHRETTCKTA